MPNFIPIEKELETRLVVLRGDICRNLMLNNSCDKDICKYIHDISICFHHWKFEKCKYGDKCRKKHVNYTSKYDKNKVKKKLLKELNNNETATESVNKAPHDTVTETDTGSTYKSVRGDTRSVIGDTRSVRGGERSGNKMSRRQKNTETFVPMLRPVDVRVVTDMGGSTSKLSAQLTDRDILIVPNLFSDMKPLELYNKLLNEVKNCGIPESELFKMWHGNDKIEGTHLIVDDRVKWKDQDRIYSSRVPTFNMVIERIANFFEMDIKATRFNYYKDTSQWKAFHFDQNHLKPVEERVQNFTVAVSFGVTRDAAFERDTRDKIVISFPQCDGMTYAFTDTTNDMWRHGILQELPVKDEGRVSIIAWGQISNVKRL